MTTGTVHLHRVLRTKPEKIYRAFVDAAAMAKWLPPYGFICKVHHMDPKVGGTFKMSFETFRQGRVTLSAGSTRSWFPANSFNTPTDSMTRTCQARFLLR
jgi:hypothetical protein